MASFFSKNVSQLRRGVRSGATFIGAIATAGLLSQFTNAPPILWAMASSVAVAAIARALNTRAPFDDGDYGTFSGATAQVVSFFAVTIGLWGLVIVVPATSSFVCEPLVPWQFSIAIFGAFGMSWLAESVRLRAPQMEADLLIHLSFFWIAPFYGFFHAPWFLAQTVVLPCDGRPFVQALVAGLAMIVATYGGQRTAAWMS